MKTVRYHGAKATMNVIKPKVDNDQNSKAIILIRNGERYEKINAIHAGWAVSESYKFIPVVLLL